MMKCPHNNNASSQQGIVVNVFHWDQRFSYLRYWIPFIPTEEPSYFSIFFKEIIDKPQKSLKWTVFVPMVCHTVIHFFGTNCVWHYDSILLALWDVDLLEKWFKMMQEQHGWQWFIAVGDDVYVRVGVDGLPIKHSDGLNEMVWASDDCELWCLVWYFQSSTHPLCIFLYTSSFSHFHWFSFHVWTNSNMQNSQSLWFASPLSRISISVVGGCKTQH